MNEPDEVQITEAFSLIATLGTALGIRLDELPGLWDFQVDELWRIEINGHDAPINDHHGMPVQPFTCHLSFNGWPAGILGVSFGEIAAGSVANEDTFIEAMKRAIERIEKGKH